MGRNVIKNALSSGKIFADTKGPVGSQSNKKPPAHQYDGITVAGAKQEPLSAQLPDRNTPGSSSNQLTQQTRKIKNIKGSIKVLQNTAGGLHAKTMKNDKGSVQMLH